MIRVGFYDFVNALPKLANHFLNFENDAALKTEIGSHFDPNRGDAGSDESLSRRWRGLRLREAAPQQTRQDEYHRRATRDGRNPSPHIYPRWRFLCGLILSHTTAAD